MHFQKFWDSSSGPGPRPGTKRARAQAGLGPEPGPRPKPDPSHKPGPGPGRPGPRPGKPPCFLGGYDGNLGGGSGLTLTVKTNGFRTIWNSSPDTPEGDLGWSGLTLFNSLQGQSHAALKATALGLKATEQHKQTGASNTEEGTESPTDR